MGWYLILATVPVSVFGLIFSDQIETGARNLWVIAVTLIALAVVLFAAEQVGSRRRRGRGDQHHRRGRRRRRAGAGAHPRHLPLRASPSPRGCSAG